MKNFKYYFAGLAIVAMLFTSCSKEEDSLINDPSEKATLSFGAVLNDLLANRSQAKQAMGDIPECSDAAPSYVEVVLSGTANVGSMATPLVVDVNPNPYDYDGDGVAEYFTEESMDLELVPGPYSLDFFAVYDEDDNLIWLAPYDGGTLSNFVSDPLPIQFNLGAGTKKYVDVEVLCFDDRDVNEYGYLFFDIIGKEAYEFCVFVNYCTDNGRHYPGRFRVDVWLGIDETGTLLHSNLINNTSTSGEDPSAEPLCFALPNLPEFEDDEAYIFYRVTLLDFAGVYDIEDGAYVFGGTLSRDDITGNFDGAENIDYEHLRFNCDPEQNNPCPGPDTDGDGIPDSCDPCPNVPYWLDSDGDCIPDFDDPCPNNPDPDCRPDEEEPCDEESDCNRTETTWMWGDHTITKKDNDGLSLTAQWGWAEYFEVGQSQTSFNMYGGAGQNNINNGFLAGVVSVSVSGTTVTLEIDAEPGVNLDKLDIYLSDAKPITAAPGQFKKLGGHTDSNPCSTATNTYTFEYSGDGNFWLMVHGEACE